MKSLRRMPSKKGPLQFLKQTKWNVFQDFSAFRTYFFIFVFAYTAYVIWHLFQGEWNRAGSSSLIAATSLLPLYFWTRGNISGLPIFPLYGFTFFYTFALQILTRDELTDVRAHFILRPADLWGISLIISISLLAGTWTWLKTSQKPEKTPVTCKTFRRPVLIPAILSIFVGATLVTILIASEKLPVPQAIFSVFRAFAGTGSIVAGFILAYHWGLGQLPKPALIIFLVSLFLYLAASTASLYLITSISLAGVSLAGYVLGKRRIPWLTVLLCVVVFGILHEGKGEMRVKYWGERKAVASVGFLEYPAYFSEWFSKGWKNVTENSPQSSDNQTSIIERSGLIQIFATAYKLSPDPIPYMKGETYKLLPVAIIPRVFYPNKPATHEGQRSINIHYRIQTEDSILGTSIGWGLFNEAYANFGAWGTIGFMAIWGWLSGWVTRKTAHVPLLSFRGMLGVLFLAMCIQTEMASGIWMAALFQAFVILFGIQLFFMIRDRNPLHSQPSSDHPGLYLSASFKSLRKSAR